MAIRPVYSKLVLPSRKSLEIIINIKIIKIKKKVEFLFNGGCPLIRACSLIRSNTVIIMVKSACVECVHGHLQTHKQIVFVLLTFLYVKNEKIIWRH